MPVSKNRRKNGKRVKHSQAKRSRRLESDMAEVPTGVSLQDLINMVAYQEYQQAGLIEGPAIPDTGVEFDDPDAQAVIMAYDESKNDSEENEDER